MKGLESTNRLRSKQANGEHHRPIMRGTGALQLGVRWQIGATPEESLDVSEGSTPPRSPPPRVPHHVPQPLPHGGLTGGSGLEWWLGHPVWRTPLLRQTLSRLRVSPYVACLAMVAVLAMLNGVVTVLILEAVLGSSSSGSSSRSAGVGLQAQPQQQQQQQVPQLQRQQQRPQQLGGIGLGGTAAHSSIHMGDSLKSSRSLHWSPSPPGSSNLEQSKPVHVDGASERELSSSHTNRAGTKTRLGTIQQYQDNRPTHPSSGTGAGTTDERGTTHRRQQQEQLKQQNDEEAAAIEAAEGGFEEKQPEEELASDWAPSSQDFLRRMQEKWVINSYSSEPGVYLLQQREDYACVLLLQDVCYVYMEGHSALHNPNVGVWFAQDLPRPAGEDEEEEEEEESAEGINGAGALSTSAAGGATNVDAAKGGVADGSQGGKRRKKPSVFTRDLSKVDVSHDVCNLFSSPEEPQDKGPFASDPRDLTYLQAREALTLGKFVGRTALAEYVDSSSERSRRVYMDEAAVEAVDVGILTRDDSEAGHFSENVVPLAEAARHFVDIPAKQEVQQQVKARGQQQEAVDEMEALLRREGEGGSGGGGSSPPLVYTVFFPSSSHHLVRSRWTHDMSRLLLGPRTSAVGGRVEGSPTCFRNAAFVLNARHSNHSAALLRVRAYEAVDAGMHKVAKEKQQARRASASGGSKAAREAAAALEFDESLADEVGLLPQLDLAGGQKGDRGLNEEKVFDVAWQLMIGTRKRLGSGGRGSNTRVGGRRDETLALAAAAASWGGGFQITVSDGGRMLDNLPEVLALLRRVFPKIPVHLVHFDSATLAQQIRTMQRTILFVSVYGPALGNLIFMPPTTSIVVLFPYKYYSEEYRAMAARLGLEYAFWENVHLARSRYPDKCMLEHGFAKLSKAACWKRPACLSCARERAITNVRIQELEEVLLGGGTQTRVNRVWWLAETKLEST
eukprot:TRINITY_DN1063_c0_g1_i1.p1 TRINITY_DN1063_c0_g1~~TRINITY_DN1063_c0_g1_i1.p1  ORF type:complete len:959 (-),score=179.53 TRINITY_DN1063_c0_g1_i1:952-3828(-)